MGKFRRDNFLAGSLGAPDYVCGIFVGVLLLILGMGVNGIIRVSMVKGSYDTLLQEGEFSKDRSIFRCILVLCHCHIWSYKNVFFKGRIDGWNCEIALTSN